ncbi:MAG TPA: glycogen/starch/alpha-glucan phosphorylase, partial [Lacipirellulaceae bacterium]|nr:glycogen/starch/alpha-glucan phosphorylase [Lacipirellulaceae bacterium]
ITDAIGDTWISDLDQLRQLTSFADDDSFRNSFRKAKRDAKCQFATWLMATTGQTVDPDSIFDCQIKRIHEYKRQLLNAPDAWTRKAILNVAGSGKFSSDRTIAEYASEIWDAEPCPVP